MIMDMFHATSATATQVGRWHPEGISPGLLNLRAVVCVPSFGLIICLRVCVGSKKSLVVNTLENTCACPMFWFIHKPLLSVNTMIFDTK